MLITEQIELINTAAQQKINNPTSTINNKYTASKANNKSYALNTSILNNKINE